MRVVAGSARGRRLVTPTGRDVRPTLDRVREAVFNAVGSLGGVEGSSVLDLFAGSGALGVEALSRGAAGATFVDDSPTSLAAVRANLDATGFADRAGIVRGDALGLLESADPRLVGPFDLVLADPPYAFDDWGRLLALVAPLLAGRAVVVAESDRAVLAEDAAHLGRRDATILRERRYGGTVVTMITIELNASGDAGDVPGPGARGR